MMVDKAFNKKQLPFSNKQQFAKNCPLLGYFTASNGHFLLTLGTTYRSHFQGVTVEDEIDRFTRNVDKKLSIIAA
jgi:hypothetical protein